MHPADTPKQITADPNSKDPKPILRSKNDRFGMDFTWSTWLFVDSKTFANNTASYKHVFSKGEFNDISSNGLLYPNNGPGMYIYGPRPSDGFEDGGDSSLDTWNYHTTRSGRVRSSPTAIPFHIARTLQK